MQYIFTKPSYEPNPENNLHWTARYAYIPESSPGDIITGAIYGKTESELVEKAGNFRRAYLDESWGNVGRPAVFRDAEGL